MIAPFQRDRLASDLELPARSTQTGGRMTRGWYRASERRRGPMSLIAAVAGALPSCREARALRERFEAELRELLNARDIELRDGPPMSRPPASTISVAATCGDLARGA